MGISPLKKRDHCSYYASLGRRTQSELSPSSHRVGRAVDTSYHSRGVLWARGITSMMFRAGIILELCWNYFFDSESNPSHMATRSGNWPTCSQPKREEFTPRATPCSALKQPARNAAPRAQSSSPRAQAVRERPFGSGSLQHIVFFLGTSKRILAERLGDTQTGYFSAQIPKILLARFARQQKIIIFIVFFEHFSGFHILYFVFSS